MTAIAVQQSSKKEKGLMDMGNSVVTCSGGRGIRGLNGNGKNTMKNKIKKEGKNVLKECNETVIFQRVLFSLFECRTFIFRSTNSFLIIYNLLF